MNFRKIIIIILLPIVITGTMFPGIFANIFLYYLNGSSLVLGEYKVKFPFGHWAYYKEHKYAYTISGRKIDGKTLKVEIIKQNIDIRLNDIITHCDASKKKYDNISGTQYICNYDNNKSMMYFLSIDKKIILNSGDNYDKMNKLELLEYELLFNRITPF